MADYDDDLQPRIVRCFEGYFYRPNAPHRSFPLRNLQTVQAGSGLIRGLKDLCNRGVGLLWVRSEQIVKSIKVGSIK